MKTKILLFMFLCLSSVNAIGQGIITRQSTRMTEPKNDSPKKKLANSNQRQKQRIGTLNGHEWVDLGLSVKWGTCNVGANSPSDYGGYYVWGETRTKSRYDWDNCFDCLDSIGDSWGTYKLGGQTRITTSSGHDTARENWGGTWRMPTDLENEELCKKCKWTWTTKNGHKGYNVTGPNGNSIFLPAAGYRDGTNLESVGGLGSYWSNTLCSTKSDIACDLYFGRSFHEANIGNRSYGRSIRPVTD